MELEGHLGNDVNSSTWLLVVDIHDRVSRKSELECDASLAISSMGSPGCSPGPDISRKTSYQNQINKSLLLPCLLLQFSHRCPRTPTSPQLRPLWPLIHLRPFGSRLRSLTCSLPARGNSVHELPSELLGDAVISCLVVVG